MALYSLSEAENYFQHNALPAPAWANELTADQKGIALEIVDRRFQSLPWKEKYRDPDVRKVSAGIEAAFFSYVVQLTIDFCPTNSPVATTSPDKADLLNVLADLPRDVGARLLPFLDASYLTPITQQATADARLARPMATENNTQRAVAKL